MPGFMGTGSTLWKGLRKGWELRLGGFGHLVRWLEGKGGTYELATPSNFSISHRDIQYNNLVFMTGPPPLHRADAVEGMMLPCRFEVVRLFMRILDGVHLVIFACSKCFPKRIPTNAS